jgi:hypothetical protein
MEVLLLRLTLTPATVLLASVVQRRWGHALGGRLIGLPLTTGPFLILIALTRGTEATAVAARGVVAGQVSVVVFCIAYTHLAQRRPPWQALSGTWAISAGSVVLVSLIPGAWPETAVVIAVVAIGLASWPAGDGRHPEPLEPRRWETPVRVVVSGTLVAVLTGAARIVGPYVAGLLATTPVILSVLAPATQRSAGPTATAAMLRGTLGTMPGTVLFATVLSSTAGSFGLGWAFAAAGGALLLSNVISDQVLSDAPLSDAGPRAVVDTIGGPIPTR